MLKIEALKKFLRLSKCPIAQKYNENMEVQVQAARDNGIAFTGVYKAKKWHGWQDPKTREIWKSFRIPWNADSNPTYVDTKLNWDLNKHIEGIGMTGWDWVNKQSLWVGYDFDSITNHAEGILPEQLKELEEKTRNIPWVSLLRSTSGQGLHLYIFFSKPVKTMNHTEHTALARSLLSILTVETGFNFKNTVDCVGSVLWIYHRKSEGTTGLTWVKEHKEPFPVEKIPDNWREHILVTKHKSRRIKRPENIEKLSQFKMGLFMNKEHLSVLQWLNKNAKAIWWWDSDYQMLVCHTKDLENCHRELQLKGFFSTTSEQTDVTQNCFAYPEVDGSFVVRRYGKGISEAKYWQTDENGWTTTYFNVKPTFHDALIANGGLEDSKGKITFQTARGCAEGLLALNIVFDFPDWMSNRTTTVQQKESKLVIQVQAERHDPPTDGFIWEKTVWTKIVGYKEKKRKVFSQDDLVRHVVSNGTEAGWYINVEDSWILHNKSNVQSVLISTVPGIKKNEIEEMLGNSILSPYHLVNRPFEDEYLSGRRWNKDAAQLAFQPEIGLTSTWWSILEHIGRGLDEAVQKNDWCSENGIITGADYLFSWVASLFQNPKMHLPYLFLYGGQNTGKSSFHEALSLLFKNKRGYSRVDQALLDKSGFNYEVAHSLLGIIEETDLGHNKQAGNKIKDWVTGETISIRELYKNTYEIENTLHFIQCSNDVNACPVFPNDTRIVVIQVEPLNIDIPKYRLMESLKEEAPAFLYELLNHQLVDPQGRLGVPVLVTEEKGWVMQDNQNELEEFMNDRTKIALGQLTDFNEFFADFQIWLNSMYPTKVDKWVKRRVMMELPIQSPVVKGYNPKDKKTLCIGNLTMDLTLEETNKKRWTVGKGKILQLGKPLEGVRVKR